MSGELRPPASPTRSAPLDPACFWIEDSSRNRFALNGISAVSPTRFFKHFFLNKKKFLKSFATYAQFFFKSDKKKMLKKKIATTFFFQHLKKSSNIFFRPKIVWNVGSINIKVSSFFFGGEGVCGSLSRTGPYSAYVLNDFKLFHFMMNRGGPKRCSEKKSNILKCLGCS